VLGLPRVGRDCELETALEAYWRGEPSDGELRRVARGLRRRQLLGRLEAAGAGEV
jgi:5-methyltetrahydropteroyltriglutamate--homocysteine methyltransferase